MGWDTQSPVSVPLSNQALAAGVQFEPFSPVLLSTATAPSTQLQAAILIGVLPGATLNGIVFRVGTAAVGATVPTTARFAALDITGKVLVRSANVAAVTNWALGPNGIPFSAPYQVPAGTTALYATFVVNGTWSTPATILNAGIQPASTMIAFGTAAPLAFSVSAVADLPAVGSSVVISGAAATRGYYLGFY